MKNTTLFYALVAIGILALVVGVVMRAAMHFQGKAYAVLVLGAILLIAGVVGMFMGKSSSSAVSSK